MQDSSTRIPLDTERIVAAGIRLADAEGVDALTMRRLADSLGFKVMALYNHVANKDALLALMVDSVASSIELPSPDEPAMRAVRNHALATRSAFVRHRWAPSGWLRYLPGPHRIEHMESLLAIFARSGLPGDVAHHGFHAVNNHVLGYTLQELAMAFDANDAEAPVIIADFLATVSVEDHPYTVAHVNQHLDGDTGSSFELVLGFILDGLVTLGRTPPASR